MSGPQRVWGPETVRSILPHGPGFILVDAVWAFRWGRRPQIDASFRVREDHPILAAHFPDQALWPGAYCIEGLAQTCMLLAAGLLRTHWDTPNFDPQGIEREGARSTPDFKGARLARADVKFLGEVLPGDELHYMASLSSGRGPSREFLVEAHVGARRVAAGRILAHSPTGSRQ